MNNEATHSFEPQKSNKIKENECLTWPQLEEIFDDLPDDLCQRSQMIIDLYDEGACSLDVEQDLQAHLLGCEQCQDQLNQYRDLSTMFEDRRNLEDTISESDIKSSFERFIAQYGALLDESTDEEAKINVNESDPSTLQVEGPQSPNRRQVRRVQAGFGLLFAAALLFAYGPALIETPIHEPSYPSAEIDGSSESVELSGFPLHKTLNRTLSNSLKLSKIRPLTRNETTEVALYTLQGVEGDFLAEMTKLKLTPGQVASFKKKLAQSSHTRTLTFDSAKREARRSSKSQLVISIQQLGETQVLEYVSELYLYQWAINGPRAIDVLEGIALAHLEEL